MKIAQAGIYVMVQKYGLEGLLVIEDTSKHVQLHPEQEMAEIGDKKIRVFDRVKVHIVAQMVEFRRSVCLVYDDK